MVKRLIPWLLIPLAVLQAASLVRISQLRNQLLTQGVLASRLDGTIYVAGGLTFDTAGNIVLPPTPANLPILVVTRVTPTTQNSFPIPAGKSVCDVSRNIPQSPGEDYNVVGTNIVFITPPVVDDVVRLICF